MSWAFYPVFVGTLVSIMGLSRIALKNHDKTNPRTLSELAAAEQSVLSHFRSILIVCDLLFALTVFGFIVPRITNSAVIAIFGAMMIGGELFVSLLPARGRTFNVHFVLAQIMAVGMFGLALIFCFELPMFLLIEAAILLTMCVMIFLTFVNKKHYLVYELAYIFASHLSIVVAAIALR